MGSSTGLVIDSTVQTASRETSSIVSTTIRVSATLTYPYQFLSQSRAISHHQSCPRAIFWLLRNRANFGVTEHDLSRVTAIEAHRQRALLSAACSNQRDYVRASYRLTFMFSMQASMLAMRHRLAVPRRIPTGPQWCAR